MTQSPARWWKFILAYFRLSKSAVCECSAGRGLYNDFHDYRDTFNKYPQHFSRLTCKRCYKEFYI